MKCFLRPGSSQSVILHEGGKGEEITLMLLSFSLGVSAKHQHANTFNFFPKSTFEKRNDGQMVSCQTEKSCNCLLLLENLW